jgi:PPM family protein phosphatase
VYSLSAEIDVLVSCATQVGKRDTNEDSYVAVIGDEAPCGTAALVAVADGMGGTGTGAAASNLALTSLMDVFSASCSIASEAHLDVPHLLSFALQKANAAVFQAQAEDESLRGMGSTCVAAAITEDAIHIVSVGDSRAYLFRDGKLTQITKDEWFKRPDGVTVVSRAIGWQPTLPTEPISEKLQEGDQLVLCTDGLTDALTEDSIQSILRSSKNGGVSAVLTETAAASPDADNVTVVVAKMLRH